MIKIDDEWGIYTKNEIVYNNVLIHAPCLKVKTFEYWVAGDAGDLLTETLTIRKHQCHNCGAMPTMDILSKAKFILNL